MKNIFNTVMTDVDIERYIFQYSTIKCCKMTDYPPEDLKTPFEAYFLELDSDGDFLIEYIELRSIHNLTDDEYTQLLEYCGVFDMSGVPEKQILKYSLSQTLKGYQFLSELGVALPYKKHSINTMIDEGVLKLKE